MAAAGEFGLQFGLAFQLMDDQMDQDALATDLAPGRQAQEHALLARTALAGLPPGPACASLDDLTGFVLAQRQ